MAVKTKFVAIIKQHEEEILKDWVKEQLKATTMRKDLMSEGELRNQSQEFLQLFNKAIQKGNLTDIATAEWADICDFLGSISRSRAQQGFSPSETATFVLSLKQPLFVLLSKALSGDVAALVDEIWTLTVVLDLLGIYSAEMFIRGRQEVIQQQQKEMLELSTPVIKVWDGVLTLPLIGTLDSARTQVVMEGLLQKIMETGSQVAIIDITGVPTVDTLVAQHLLKTVAAAKLMGGECIISGIRPQIAQAMVHLGVTFADVTTKATLADAILQAFNIYGYSVVKGKPQA